MNKLPVVGVMGSGVDEHEDITIPLGRMLAQMDVHLLTGGGGGVMLSVTKAYVEITPRKGYAIGIIPSQDGERRPKPGYPNPYVEIPIYTHLPFSGEKGKDPLSRNHINILTPDAVIFLPGGKGTRSEKELALSYNKPVISYSGHPDPDDLPVAAHELIEVQDWLLDVLKVN